MNLIAFDGIIKQYLNFFEEKELWKELFINVCILITILFIASQLFKNTGISHKSSIRIRMLFGIVGGISTSILIYFSVHITDSVVIDFRHLLEIFISIFGGLFSISITGLITATYRLLYQGISNKSIISSIGVLVVSFGCGIISVSKLKERLKITIMFIYTLIIRSIFYYILIDNKSYAFSIIVIFCITTIILGLLVSYLVQYLVAAHRLFNRLKQESTHDFLTGLNNTRQFDLKYNKILTQAIESKQKVSFLIIDIDHFKNVNDEYGHIAGDEVLKELGRLLLKNCRDIDLVSRIGGEEFSVVLGNLSKADTLKAAERIRKSVEANIFLLSSGAQLKITVSIGAAIYPDITDDITALKEAADIKLYEAKRTGRNKVCM